MCKYIIPILFISTLLLLGFSCSNCEVVEEQLLTDVQKEANPFKGFEKIEYAFGDSSIEFIGTGRRNWIEEYNVSVNSCDWGLIEFDNLTLSGNYFDIYLNMRESKYYYLTLSDPVNEIYLSSKLIIDKNGSISNYNEFLDSLDINDITYFNIYKDTLVQKNTAPVIPDSIKHAKYLYYSTEYGIVKVDFSDGSTWELKEIIW